MPDRITDQELRDRFGLIERMILEGRRKTESWGWTFVLWGVAYYVALAWSAFGRNAWAWPVTMLLAVFVTVAIASRKRARQPETTLGRAMGSIWMALGVSIFLLFIALGVTERLSDAHLFVAIIAAMLGMANGASALILRWKIQFACAVVWWATSVAACFGSHTQTMIVFLAAIFLCQIVFGVYGMVIGRQKPTRSQAIHA